MQKSFCDFLDVHPSSSEALKQRWETSLVLCQAHSAEKKILQNTNFSVSLSHGQKSKQGFSEDAYVCVRAHVFIKVESPKLVLAIVTPTCIWA